GVLRRLERLPVARCNQKRCVALGRDPRAVQRAVAGAVCLRNLALLRQAQDEGVKPEGSTVCGIERPTGLPTITASFPRTRESPFIAPKSGIPAFAGMTSWLLDHQKKQPKVSTPGPRRVLTLCAFH